MLIAIHCGWVAFSAPGGRDSRPFMSYVLITQTQWPLLMINFSKYLLSYCIDFMQGPSWLLGRLLDPRWELFEEFAAGTVNGGVFVWLRMWVCPQRGGKRM